MNNTTFLNVDLDVFSRTRLDDLTSGFGSKVIPLHVGRDRTRFRAHFELSASNRKSADNLITEFVRLVKKLPRRARTAWNRAYRRDFNIGIQSGVSPFSFELPLKVETLKLAASVNARVVVTVYGTVSVPRR